MVRFLHDPVNSLGYRCFDHDPWRAMLLDGVHFDDVVRGKIIQRDGGNIAPAPGAGAKILILLGQELVHDGNNPRVVCVCNIKIACFH